jgi:glycosyltransferase involved in cell wall biosynthesis
MMIMNNPDRLNAAIVRYAWDRAAFRVVDWSDDFAQFCTTPQEQRRTREYLDRYIESADLVLTVRDSLTKRARVLNPNSHTVPNATNMFTMAKRGSAPPPRRLRRLPRPRITYVGWLNGLRLDVELLLELCRRRPRWQFVFVGPSSHPSPLGRQLPRLTNVHVLPAVPYERLGAIYEEADVCILPNRINDHTAGNDPLKLYDYCASGKPVVCTPTAGTEACSSLVRFFTDAREAEAAIEEALNVDTPSDRRRRIEFARRNSWTNRMGRVYHHLGIEGVNRAQ